MRTLLMNMALTAATLASPALLAQDANGDEVKKTPEERARHRTEKMTSDLGLDAQRVDAAYKVNLTYANATAEVKRSQLAKEEQKRRLDLLKEERDAGLKAVLTAEQYEKMLALREQKKDEEKEQRKEARPHNE